MSSLRDRITAQRKSIADNRASYERPYRFKIGKTVVRILPGIGDDPDEFSKPYGAHYIKDPRDDSKILAVVGDAEICYGRVCPVRTAIAEFIDKCNARGDDSLAKKAKEWLARDSYVVNAEILGGVDTENKGKVVRIEFSRNQYDSVLSAMETLFMGNDSFTMKEGLTIVVERVGSGVQDTKYTFQTFPGNVPAISQSVLDSRMDLQSYVDGKFGLSVTKALTHMSTLLGKDVTQTAIGSALQAASAQLTATAEPPSEVTLTETKAPNPDEDLLNLVQDAEFTEVAQAPKADAPAVPAAASPDQFDDILKDLESLG